MNELALFAGVGGGILGGKKLGWRTRCAVEIDSYCRRVLIARQRDGILDPFPIWDDVTTFDGRPWRGAIDIVSGGFPCQDISACGKGAGIEGAKSGLWKEMARIISEVRPGFAFIENSPMLANRGLGVVLGDLAAMGYHAAWGVVSAKDCGFPHERKRLWISCADAKKRLDRDGIQNEARFARSIWSSEKWIACVHVETLSLPIDPDGYRISNGLPHIMDRLGALGNAQVPLVAATAWRFLIKILETKLNEKP